MATDITGIDNRMRTTANAAPRKTIGRFISPTNAPFTIAPINSACGANKASLQSYNGSPLLDATIRSFVAKHAVDEIWKAL